MAEYKKKPVVIEAVQWDGINLQEVKNFVGSNLEYDILDTAWQVGKGVPHVFMKIKTLEGNMECSKGDYIIKGIKGEFYPCKPDIFEATYEKVWPLSPLLEKQNADVGSMTDEEWKKHLDGLECQSE